MPNIVKNTTIINPLDLLAPHSCRGCGRLGSVLCDCCKNNIANQHTNLCPLCKSPNPTGSCPTCKNLPPAYVVGERSELIGELAQDFKFHSIRAIAHPLAEILDRILPAIDGEVAIIPLPTINRHIRERGLDHTYLVAKHLAKLRGKSYHVQKLLVRRHSSVQVGTDRANRFAQAKTAYAVTDNTTLDPSVTYLLYDDVWTTGTSMLSAVKKLRLAGAKKIIITVSALNSVDQH